MGTGLIGNMKTKKYTYERMLDWRNSESSPRHITVAEFAAQQGYLLCDTCECFVLVDDSFINTENGLVICFECKYEDESIED